MSIDFDVKDVMHKITVKFTHAFLPDAKKPYYAKAAHQPELDIHGIASKADVYNISTPPKIIEEGLNAGIKLMFHLVADGYKIKTPLFSLRIRIPGEYDGSENRLPDGVFARARLQTGDEFRKYLEEHLNIVIDGVDQSEGHIGEAHDEATNLVDDVMTIGNILTIRGSGLKIECDEDHKDITGLYFVDQNTGSSIKAEVIAVNEPRTLKAVVPPLERGKPHGLYLVTQSSAKGGGGLLKNTREMNSEFTLTAQN
jgi:hypothetical protein